MFGNYVSGLSTIRSVSDTATLPLQAVANKLYALRWRQRRPSQYFQLCFQRNVCCLIVRLAGLRRACICTRSSSIHRVFALLTTFMLQFPSRHSLTTVDNHLTSCVSWLFVPFCAMCPERGCLLDRCNVHVHGNGTQLHLCTGRCRRLAIQGASFVSLSL